MISNMAKCKSHLLSTLCFYWQVGVKVITANCREECTCHRQGRVVCTPLPCAAGQTCVLSNAKWTCIRQEGHCTISQGHIFTTYDGVSGKVPPVGSYEISALINAKSTSWFRVVIQLQKCPACPTPLVVTVTIYFHKLIVLLKQDSSVTVRRKEWKLTELIFYQPLYLSVSTSYFHISFLANQHTAISPPTLPTNLSSFLSICPGML